MAEPGRKSAPQDWGRQGSAPSSEIGIRGFTYRALILTAIFAAAFLLWRIVDVVILAFGGLLLGVLLRTLGNGLARLTRLPPGWALGVTVVLIVAGLAGAGWGLGGQIAAQSQEMAESLPNAVSRLSAWLRDTVPGGTLPDMEAAAGKLLPNISAFVTTTFGAVTNTVLIIFLGLYFAANPRLYRRGVIRLVPPSGRPDAEDAADRVATALRQWLLGKLISMVLVTVLTTGGLLLLGMPLALTLGVIAGLLEFIPFLGPIVAAIPGILLAFTESPTMALYVTLLYLGIQQVESYVIQPLVQHWAVSLPPVLGILSIVAFGLLFGFLGVLFAVPIAVTLMVLVQRLYIRKGLEGGG